MKDNRYKPNRTTTKMLEQLGYRYDTPTLDDLQSSPIESFNVYCTSLDCCRAEGYTDKQIEGGKRVFKFDAMVQDRCKRPTECPDCGHALFYEVKRCDK